MFLILSSIFLLSLKTLMKYSILHQSSHKNSVANIYFIWILNLFCTLKYKSTKTYKHSFLKIIEIIESEKIIFIKLRLITIKILNWISKLKNKTCKTKRYKVKHVLSCLQLLNYSSKILIKISIAISTFVRLTSPLVGYWLIKYCFNWSYFLLINNSCAFLAMSLYSSNGPKPITPYRI